MPNTGANDTYASMMPDLGDNANIQDAIKKYHYGNQDPTTLNESAFSSDFSDPTDGMVGKLKWIKTQIDNIQTAGASGGIFNSIIDAKGDLIVGTSADTPAKFSVGANGTFLKVDTSVGTTSLRWASLDETHLNLNPSSQSLVGNLTISKANAALILAASSGTSYLQIQSISGQNKGLQLQTGSSNRWELLSNSTSESSTATGSDLVLNRYDNSGSLLGTVLTINRSSGLSTFANNVSITGTLTVTADATFTSNAIASTAPTSSSHLTNKQYVDNSMPVGAIVAYAGSSVPTGWVVCNGQAVSRTTYAGLFSVCGTYYGSGDGSTTFNVPDLRDRFVRGGETRGTSGGSTSITTSNMPSHDHGGSTGSSNATHNHGSVFTGGESGHTHDTQFAQRNGVFAAGGSGTYSAYYNIPGKSTGASTGHFHGVTIPDANAPHTHSISPQGSGSAYWQPHYQLIYIIKGI